ncbi:hypothetical protein [Methylomonas albis]|nr:hypothetical protein [Methylomonas albis]
MRNQIKFATITGVVQIDVGQSTLAVANRLEVRQGPSLVTALTRKPRNSKKANPTMKIRDPGL